MEFHRVDDRHAGECANRDDGRSRFVYREANALAQRHRALLSTYFDCTHSMQACIGRMFVRDAGFAEYFDAVEPGLAPRCAT
ncbi:TipAS antibiotic-recognition domain-containing protein [Saccharopolyspora sp. K220]|uniref:TipAS antibiotic-recognition domain-containing protein n=1 Tax=Saccharopolyspora soli TaxID=2926618 RepID=UPI001F58018F|nr:TipAS antibiotic-recognition domain-containing protein [Saccharopolyspora soli]MCI2420904.1 TipAS antibiotic-recognition domain-containing protein [Saccharopolyspora soli]